MRRVVLLAGFSLAACADGGGGGTPFASGPGASTMATEEGSTSPGSGSPSTTSIEGTESLDTGELEASAEGSSSGPPVACADGLFACGVLCVDFQTDAANCGDCGITCVVPNAASMCIFGACEVGSCDNGWGDCDGLPANGCETQNGCAAGEACTTECGSQGVTACEGCDAVCQLPAETCNAVDDDCNGSCDEGAMAGCRESVHRANGPNGHYYTNVLAETTQASRFLESQDYWWMYTQQHEGLTALHRCDIGGGNTFLTTSNTCEGAGSIADTLGYLSPTQTCGATALYRLRSPAGRHFYTVSATERDNAVNNLSYVAEGSPGFVWLGP